MEVPALPIEVGPTEEAPDDMYAVLSSVIGAQKISLATQAVARNSGP